MRRVGVTNENDPEARRRVHRHPCQDRAIHSQGGSHAIRSKSFKRSSTLSPSIRSDRAALRDYFVTAFKVLPGLKVAFGDQLIRVYGNTAVNTGYYTFSYVKDGETKTLPARYSLTYVNNGERWLIVDHHSSAMPSIPR